MASRGDKQQKHEAALVYLTQRFIFVETSPLCYIISSPDMAVEVQDLPIMGHKVIGMFFMAAWGVPSAITEQVLGARRRANK